MSRELVELTNYNRHLGPYYIVDDQTGCWMWQRSTNHEGYGRVGVGNTAEGRTVVLAHRAYYEQAKGPVPKGLQLDHLCGTRACVNPDHLEPVTPAENVQRSRTAKLTPDDVAEIRRLDKLGWTQGRIAAQFGVGRTHVGQIILGRRWVQSG